MTRQPGGKPRERAILDAERAVAAMAVLGYDEIRANIGFLDSLISMDEIDGTTLERAYQKTNDIGSIGSLLQIDAISDVAHSLGELICRMLADNVHRRRHFEVHVQALQYAFAYGRGEIDEENSSVLIRKLAMVVNQVPDTERE